MTLHNQEHDAGVIGTVEAAASLNTHQRPIHPGGDGAR